MAGIIKKQILKVLTKFTSGLQPEDIQEIYLYKYTPCAFFVSFLSIFSENSSLSNFEKSTCLFFVENLEIKSIQPCLFCTNLSYKDIGYI